MSGRWGRLVLVALTMPLFACETGTALIPVAPVSRTTATVVLPGPGRQPLTLHLARPATLGPDAVLVLYASGDGGWFGEAVRMFDEIAAAGFPVVGLSSRAFLRGDRGAGGGPSADDIVDGYQRVLRQARVSLGLDTATPVVLSGWSRGAALAVLVGADARVRAGLGGVLAIGLPGDDALRADDDSDEGDPAAVRESPEPSNSRALHFDPYVRLMRLAPVRVVVIQATHDDYLPADAARALFGPDTPDRRLVAVEARNHRFSGGERAFADSLRAALSWLRSAHAVWHGAPEAGTLIP